eukprot:3407175-Rhodomonas_salina.1
MDGKRGSCIMTSSERCEIKNKKPQPPYSLCQECGQLHLISPRSAHLSGLLAGPSGVQSPMSVPDIA